MEHLNALPGGTQLADYEVVDVLGAGGFGITYRAWDTKLEKYVALKEYLPRDFATRTATYTVVPTSPTDQTDYKWGLERFLDEARTLARFDHPHLNKVYRFFETNGTAYLVLEYVEGQTLSHLLSTHPTLPDTHLQRIIADISSGLEEVHAAGYVHRDIKPSNIMLRGDGSAVLLDFGAARQAVGQRSKSLTSILTPGYAPIEQYDTKAEDVGPWSDLYALGMVAYRGVSGLRDTDLPDAVTRARTQRKGGPDLTPAVEVGKGAYAADFLKAIDWAIRVNEEERPQTLAAWLMTLSPGWGEAAPSPSPVPAAASPAKVIAASGGSGPRGWVSKVALAVVGAAIIGAGLWVMYPGMNMVKKSAVNPPEPPEERPEERPEPVPVTPVPVVQAEPPGDALADWRNAQQTDTSDAYRAFVARHPGSPLRRLAEKKLAEKGATQ